MFRQIFYRSTATAGETHTDIDAILHCSRRNNPELGLTGLLAVGERDFWQLVEGDDEFLSPLMAMIDTDPRHRGIEILFDRNVETRGFPGWSMARLDLDKADAVRAFLDGRPFDECRANGLIAALVAEHARSTVVSAA